MGLACFRRQFAGSRVAISCVSEVIKRRRLTSQKLCEEDAGVKPVGIRNRARCFPGKDPSRSDPWLPRFPLGPCQPRPDITFPAPPAPPRDRQLPGKCSARSPVSWPVSGQGQGHGIPAPPPGNAPPCTARTPPVAKNPPPPASHGDHPERETGGRTDPNPSGVCPSPSVFPFPQCGCGRKTPSCIPRRAAAACCGVNSGAARPRGDRI